MKLSRGKLLAMAKLTWIICLTNLCGQNGGDPESIDVRRYEIPGMPNFWYPAALVLTPGSNVGEAEWCATLVDSSNSFKVSVMGRYTVHPKDLEPYRTDDYVDSRRCLIDDLIKRYGEHSVFTIGLLICAHKVSEALEVVKQYHMASTDANGSGVRSLYIQFPLKDTRTETFRKWAEIITSSFQPNFGSAPDVGQREMTVTNVKIRND